MRLGEIAAFQGERDLQRLLDCLLSVESDRAFVDLRIGSELSGDLQVSRSSSGQQLGDFELFRAGR